MKDIKRRPRRLRRTSALRDLVRETRLAPEDFILPFFVTSGENVRREVSSMPNVFNLSIDEMLKDAREAFENGIRAFILFGLPDAKDETGSGALDDEGIVQKAIRALKNELPEAVCIADTCLCEYTSHGHCGVIKDEAVDNDATLELLAKTAVSQARAGADIIAPSAMMDNQVSAIRQSLDENGFSHIPIMSYAVKFASAFYGPFREAADSAPSFGDRRAYQMDAANGREALIEAQIDYEQGADFLMVKPAMSYLDLVRELRVNFNVPIVAYQVSGEYAMIKAAAERGWIDEKRIVLETLTSIKRAGADLIITYYALEAVRFLSQNRRR